jgi:hypothetical protein
MHLLLLKLAHSIQELWLAAVPLLLSATQEERHLDSPLGWLEASTVASCFHIQTCFVIRENHCCL